MSGVVARQLEWLLRPIQHLLDEQTVTDLHINAPNPDGETTNVFIKRDGVRTMEAVPLAMGQLENIGINAAALMRQDIAEDVPFCSTKLPQGQRLQLVRAPAVPEGRYAMAIRRPSQQAATIQQLIDYGTFSEVRTAELIRTQPRKVILELLELKAAGKWPELIQVAIRNGLNVVWAGMVGTGKTYDLRAFLEAIPLDWRLVTVEDMEEIINLRHPNVVNLLYPKGKGQSVSNHTAEDCIEAALRLDMDMLLCQEIRDAAAWSYLRALNSGHPGMTSCHAGSAEGAFKSIGLMVRQHDSGRTLENDDLQALLRDLIHVVAYCEDIDGRKRVTQVYFEPELQRGMPKAAAYAFAAE